MSCWRPRASASRKTRRDAGYYRRLISLPEIVFLLGLAGASSTRRLRCERGDLLLQPCRIKRLVTSLPRLEIGWLDLQQRGELFHREAHRNAQASQSLRRHAGTSIGAMDWTRDSLSRRMISSSSVALRASLAKLANGKPASNARLTGLFSDVCGYLGIEVNYSRKEISAHVPRQTRKSHSGGHRFDPVQLHQRINNLRAAERRLDRFG